jgi:uncharacterized protein (TIGR03067 family)
MYRGLLLFAVPCLAFLPALFPKPNLSAEDLKLVQGEWLLSAQFVDGSPILGDATWQVQIDGDRLKYVIGGQTSAKYVLTLDASTEPKRFTFKGLGDAGSCRGIYRLEGDRLELCYDAAGGDYPESFEGRGKYIFREFLKRKRS